METDLQNSRKRPTESDEKSDRFRFLVGVSAAGSTRFLLGFVLFCFVFHSGLKKERFRGSGWGGAELMVSRVPGELPGKAGSPHRGCARRGRRPGRRICSAAHALEPTARAEPPSCRQRSRARRRGTGQRPRRAGVWSRPRHELPVWP